MNIDELILQQIRQSFEDKVATLPTPPPGYYYAPDGNFHITREREKFCIEFGIVLEPIIK